MQTVSEIKEDTKMKVEREHRMVEFENELREAIQKYRGRLTGEETTEVLSTVLRWAEETLQLREGRKTPHEAKKRTGGEKRKMRLLPTEQKEAEQEAAEIFRKDGAIKLCEPCDCGSHIQHNNGGNYHEIVEILKSSGRFFVKLSDTCDLTPPAEWEETSEVEAEEIVKERARDGYSFV